MTKVLAQTVQVEGRFARSVHIERDHGVASAVKGYVLTRFSADLARRILASARIDSSERAWSITGTFGSGKSAFALFLTALVTDGRSAFGRAALRAVSRADDRMSRELRSVLDQGIKLCPVLVTGSRAALRPAIAEAMASGLKQFLTGRKGPKPLIREFQRIAAAPGDDSEATRDLVTALERATELVTRTGGGGLLLLIDELGKFLEHVSASAGHDIYLLQQIAELAARSGKSPLLLVTMLHQAFERYARGLDRATQDEWAKVQGRFADVAFFQPPEEVALVVAHTLRRTAGAKTEKHIKQWAKTAADTCCDLGLSQAKRGRERTALAGVLARAYPIHPVTLWALPLVFRSFGQNERSLFTFLAGGEPHSLRAFLKETRFTDSCPVFSLPQLYDYLVTNLGSSLLAHPASARWAEINVALERLRGHSEDCSRVVKAVGVLNALGDVAGLSSTEDLLRFALPDVDVDAALRTLVKDRVLLHRKFDGSFRIWEGSDFDCEKELATLRANHSPPRPLARALSMHEAPRAIVARRESIATGYLRFFDRQFVSASEIEQVIQAGTGKADGRIFLCVPESAADVAALEAAAATHKDPRLIFVIPHHYERLASIFDEAYLLKKLDTASPVLAGDRVARREVSGRLAEAQQRLDSFLDHAFAPRSATWCWRGRVRPVESKREVSRLLSKACRSAYRDAPCFQNELINRWELSSAAAAARSDLLARMVSNGNQKDLGIEGHPPQKAMYDTLLRETGIHRRRGGSYGFGAPSKGVHRGITAMWDACQHFLDESEAGRKSVDDLYATLRAPPYGMRDGVLPVVLIALLLAEDSSVSLYESGSFIPGLTPELVEMLAKKSETFELQRCRIRGVRATVLQRIGKLLHKDDAAPKELLGVVKPLCQFAAQLPLYSRRTRHVSERAQAVRDSLLKATEPDRLVFELLPRACGHEPFPDKRSQALSKHAQAFAEDLGEALRELQVSLDDLKRRIENTILGAFDIAGRGDKGREELRVRARPLMHFSIDPKLRSFAFRASDDRLSFDQWLDSVASLLAQKPIASWLDVDYPQFETRLREVRRSFRHAESLCFGHQRAKELLKERFEAIRIGVTSPTDGEREEVAIVAESQQPLLRRGIEALEHAIGEEGLGADHHVALAALARVAMRVLESSVAETEDVEEEQRGLA